jgi:DNA repair protein SbcC/Rad50
MIKRVELQNFQSHKESSIEFHPGVNTFIGTSDHGKSSIMRAIQLVTENKPSGNGYISNWIINDKGKPVDNTIVAVELDDGTVTRIKGVDNKYTVSIDEKSQTYEAFGMGVVPEIVDYLNFSDTNIQRQEDNFFLFAETSGEVMRRINSYTNLDLIDTVLSNADKDMSRVKREQKEMAKRIAEFEQSLSMFEDLDRREKEYRSILHIYNDLKKKKEQFETLQKHTERIQQLVPRLESFQEIERAERKINRLQTAVVELKETKNQNETVSTLIYKYHKLFKQYKTLMIVDDKQTIEQIDRIEKAYEEERELIREQKTLMSFIDSFYSAKSRIEKLETQLNELHEEYHEVLGDVCPICGSPIKR